MQTAIVYAVSKGFQLDKIMSMSLGSFTSLLKSISQVETAAASRDAWTALIASAGDSKAMKAHIKQFSGRQ